MDLEDIYTPYFDASQHYTAIITPYAVHLLYVLILLELTTIGLTWMAGSNDDPPEILWRLVRLIFTGGFAYWWIYNAWTLGMIVIGSFNQLGVVLTGQPGLTPIAFLRSALRLSQILFSAPGASGLLPDLALRIEEFLLSNVIFLVFLIVAALALFTITAGYIILAGGIIIVPFLACRFTSSLGEGYFTWIVKTGVVIFFFYLVLGIAESFVGRWGTGVAAICGAKAGISLPSPLLGAAPVAAPVLTCTVPIMMPDLLRLLADCVILAFIAVGVPFTAGAIVSHGVNAAVEHFAAAKYLAGGAVRPVARSISNAVQRFTKSESQSRTTLEQRLAAGAAAAAKNPPRQSQIATQQLTKPPAINSFGVQRTQALSNTNGAKPTSKI